MKIQNQLNIVETENIKLLSAYLQDAIIRVSDIAFLPKVKRFVALCNRFCWENKQKNERILSGLHFANVQKTTAYGIDQSQPNQLLHLLAICFEEGQKPNGKIRLIFADNSEICLEVEAVEAQLNNIEGAWSAKHRPQHILSEKNS